jgi:hypothetical protein
VVCSAVVLFLTAVPAALLAVPVVSARRVALPDSSPPAVVPCTPRATSRLGALLEQHAPVLASVLVSVPVLDLARRAPEWEAAPAVLCRLRVKLRVRSARVARSVVAVSNIRRPKKDR